MRTEPPATVRLADGRRIGYAEYGDPQGASVLAIHGTPGSRFMFALTDKAAREQGLAHLRARAPRLRPFRFSPQGRRLAQAADDLRRFADALGLERFALIGVSGGGPYAVAAAASMAERVALLALISPVGPIAECQSSIRMSKLHRSDLHPDWPLAARPAPRSSGRCVTWCAMRRTSLIAG